MTKNVLEKDAESAASIQKTVQYTDLEKQQVKKYWEKTEQIKPSLKYKATQKNNVTEVFMETDKQTLSQYQQAELQRATLYAATGSASCEYSRLLIGQTMGGFFKEGPIDDTFIANTVHEALLALNPKDEIEGMLCSRLLVLHDQYMNFIARTTSPEQTSKGVDMNVNRATKLMRLYNETLETLNRYRRKGEQRVVVQHVNVNSGGQAIVGSEIKNQGGGVNGKK